MKKTYLFLMGLACAALMQSSLFAQTGATFSYQGSLTTAAAQPLSGKHLITVRLYASPTDDVALHTEEFEATVTHGIFDLTVGTNAKLPPSVLGKAKYLGISVNGSQELSPRTAMVAAPMASGLTTNATGAVRSFNGASGDIELKGGPGMHISAEGNVVTIHSTNVSQNPQESNVVHGLTGTENQVLVDGTFGVEKHDDLILTLPQDIHEGATPEFEGMTLTNLSSGSTANAIVVSNGGVLETRTIESVGGGVSGDNPFITFEADGGELNDNRVLAAGDGISLTDEDEDDGLLTISNTGVLSITGTANQVNADASTGDITLSLPQNIDAGASPTFEGMTLSDFGAGVVHSDGSGVLSSSEVVYSDIQDVSAERLLGNPTNASATMSEISLGYGLQFNGSSLETFSFAMGNEPFLTFTSDLGSLTDNRVLGNSDGSLTLTIGGSDNDAADVILNTAHANSWTALQTFSSVDINGGTIDGTTIGSTTAASGKFTTLIVTSTSDLQGAVSSSIDDLDINDDVQITGNLNVNTNTDLDGTLNVDGTSSLNGAVSSASDDLDINDDVQITGSLNVNTNTDLDGTLNVDGAVTHQSTLDQKGNLSSSVDDLDITDDVQITGSLNVNTNTDLDGTLNVDGTSSLNGAVSSAVDDLDIADDVEVTGSVDINTNLNVDGNSTLNGTVSSLTDDLDITDDVQITGSLNVNTNTDLDGTLNVDGAATHQSTLDQKGNLSSSVDDLDITDDVQITGSVDINTNLDVDGNTTLNGNVDLGNAAGDAISLKGTLTGLGSGHSLGTLATDATVLTINGDDFAGVNELDVQGDANVSGMITGGAMTLNGDLDMNQNDIIDLGDVVFSTATSNMSNSAGDVNIDDNLEVTGNIHADGTVSSGNTIVMDGTTTPRTIIADAAMSVGTSSGVLDLYSATAASLRLNTNGSIQRGAGGDPRGINAIDLQTARSAATQVASGANAVIAGGTENTASADRSTVGGGNLNTATNTTSTIGGGYSNNASGFSATVSGGTANDASGHISAVGGGIWNTASSSYSNVGGGLSNTASDFGATVGGGSGNSASGNLSTISGGTDNTATDAYTAVGGGTSNDATGYISTIAGGSANTASGEGASIGGGVGQTADGWRTTVGGGHGNTASDLASTVGGGNENAAIGGHSTVSGGMNNTASGGYTTVGGGRLNSASSSSATVSGGLSNTASGQVTVVGGGTNNTASGEGATIGGGGWDGTGPMGQTASGAASTIAGGYGNTAVGSYSAIPGGREMTLDFFANRSFGFNANNAGGTADMTISASNTAVFGNANLWLANTNSTASQLRFYEAQAATGAFPAAGTNYTAFRAQAQAADITYTLPADDGGADDVLLTDGAGNLTWGQVTTLEIALNTILANDIATGAVETAEILNETILAEDIATGAVTTSEILNETILAEDIATGAVTTSEILNETILAEDIATGAVTTSEILNETILAEDIATGAVTTSEILNETILAEDIATGAVTTSEILNETILSEDVLNNTLTSDDIGANAVGNSEMADNAIGNAEMLDNAIGNAEMLDNAIGNAEMADNAIGNAEMADNAIGNAEMADNAIGNAEMADNAIGNAEMADNAIGNAEMADNAVGSAEITNGSVAYADIQNVSNTSRLLGRYSAGSGSIQEITVGSGLTLSSGGELSSTGNITEGSPVSVTAGTDEATVDADGITGVRVISDNDAQKDEIFVVDGINGQTLHIFYETTGNGDLEILNNTISVTNGGPGCGIILLKVNGNWRIMGAFDNLP